MNINYNGSVAQRFMQFRSSLLDTSEATTDIFSAVSIYVPGSLASANIVDFDGTGLTADTPVVKTVTLDNYAKVLKGSLLAQWSKVFNDGTNKAAILYLVVFDDEDFAPTVANASIEWAPLTKAFKELYHISFFKVMFSETYNGAEDDENYFDMALCLSYLCEFESTLSMFLCEVHIDLSKITSTDANACWILSKSRADETTFATTLTGSTLATRAEYFWGFVHLIGGAHTEILVHNGAYIEPIRLGVWFLEPNDSGRFVGNKLAKIRLSDSAVKPTGKPSWLNADVNLNLPEEQYTILDDKHCGYLISIADGSDANAEITRDRTVTDFPVNAYNIAKYVDYACSQALAKYATKIASLTNPVLTNAETYEYIQNLVATTLQTAAATKRLENITLSFPEFSVAKKGNSFEGMAVWSANYVDDLESVFISGSISF